MKKTLFLLLVAASLFAADYAAEGKLWWAHVQFLADDKLEGRNTGTEGYRKAVAYVAGQFERMGLQPAGTSSYEQPVKFETRTLTPDQSSVALILDHVAKPLTPGIDATLSSRGEAADTVTAPMVFVGYGLVIPEAGRNDVAGLDLHGKVAVYVNATGPTQISGNVKSHYSSAVERWTALRAAGAIGVATIANPRGPGAGAGQDASAPAGGRSNTGRGGNGGRGGGGAALPAQPTMSLADPALRETAGMQVSLAIARSGGEKFFEGSGHTYDSIMKLVTDNQPLPAFPLSATLQVKTAFTKSTAEASNVVGMLPGSDPNLKNEYVVFSAHLDHVGIGRPVNGDALYNGAMDNASGVASVLEVARLFQESGVRPKRSLIFLAVTAEEKGELGSRYFAAHPTVPIQQIVADINLDMFLPLYKLKVLEVQGLVESSLGDTVREAARKKELRCRLIASPTRIASFAAISTVLSAAACPLWHLSLDMNLVPRKKRSGRTG